MKHEVTILDCPACGSEEHRVLKSNDQNMTVQCMECSRVRSLTPKRERIVEVNLVVSEGEGSFRTRIPTPAEEEIRVGYEFGLDDHRMIVTGIEVDGQQTPRRARADEVKTLFAKVFDMVALKFSVNEGDVTKSFKTDVDPDMEIPVGLILPVEGRLLVIKTLKSDQNRTLHKGFLLARNITRAFCDPAPSARPGQKVPTRPRGRRGDAPARPRRGPKRS